MTTYNTGNPVPSGNAYDRFDNSQTFDEVVNGQLTYYANRKGQNVLSLRGMQLQFSASQQLMDAAFQEFLEGTGWSSLGAYAAGISIVSHTQTVDYEGQPYQLKSTVPASLDAPYVTTGNWAVEGVNFKLVGDSSLRQDLSGAQGASHIGTPNGTLQQSLDESLSRTFSSFSQLSMSQARHEGEIVKLLGHTVSGIGGGDFYWDAASVATPDGGSVSAVSGVTNGRWLRVRPSVISASMWGMLPNVTTDQSQSIQKALNYASSIGGGVVKPVNGISYLAMDQNTISGVGLNIPSNCWLDLRGCELRAMPTDMGGYSIVLFNEDCDMAGVFGGKIIGDRDGHTGTSGEWGMGISCRGASRIFIDSIGVDKCWGDGIVVTNNLAGDVNTPSKQIWIDKVVCDGNRRQGLSIINVDGLFLPSGTFKNTNGAAPQAGIDIEPNAGGFAKNIRIGSVHCIGNAGSGFLSFASSSTPTNKSITIDSLICDNNGATGLTIAYCSGLSIGTYFASGNLTKSCSIQISNNIDIGHVYASANGATGGFSRADFEVVGSTGVTLGRLKISGTTGGSLVFQVRGSSGVSVEKIDILNSLATEGAVVIENASSDVDFGYISVNGCPATPVAIAANCNSVTISGGRFKNLSRVGGSVIKNGSAGAIIKGIVLEPIGSVRPLYGIENTGNYSIISGCRIRPEALSGVGGTGAPIRDTSTGSVLSANITA